MLEVIDKGRCSDEHPAPLLFVHGGNLAGWCWDEHFLDVFADKGFRAVAVSLRGHGASTLSQPLNWCSVADYVDARRQHGKWVIGLALAVIVVAVYLLCLYLLSEPSHAFRWWDWWEINVGSFVVVCLVCWACDVAGRRRDLKSPATS